MKQFIRWTMVWLSSFPILAATLELHHSKAELGGPAIREQDKDCIGAWGDENTTVVWSLRIRRPCEIEIECLQAAEARSAGNGYDVAIGEEKVSDQVVDTGAWNRFRHGKVGRLKIPTTGEYEIAVVCQPKDNQAVMNLRSLRISGLNLSAEVLAYPRER